MENEDLIPLSEAAAISGLSAVHLGLLARTGKLKARKLGRDWMTTQAAVEEYARDSFKRSRDPLKYKR